MHRLALLAAVLAIGAGCSAPVAGSPAPGPVRPREVRLDGVDPCTLLTPDQRKQLGLDQPPQSLTSAGGDRVLCSWRGNEPRAVSASVILLLQAGIERFDRSFPRAVFTDTVLRGYPSLEIQSAGPLVDCELAVDVAAGQVLDVHFSDDGRKPPVPLDQLCDSVRVAADFALGNVLAGR